MGPPDRHAPLLETRTPGQVAGAVLAGLVWTAVWVGLFFAVGDALAGALGATGQAWTLLAVVLPLALTTGWLAVMARAVRAVARRRRLLRAEFIEPPPPPASRASGG